MTPAELGLAYRTAMLQTDPDGNENARAGAAFIAVLDQINVHCAHASVLATCAKDRWFEWGYDSGD